MAASSNRADCNANGGINHSGVTGGFYLPTSPGHATEFASAMDIDSNNNGDRVTTIEQLEATHPEYLNDKDNVDDNFGLSFLTHSNLDNNEVYTEGFATEESRLAVEAAEKQRLVNELLSIYDVFSGSNNEPFASIHDMLETQLGDFGSLKEETERAEEVKGTKSGKSSEIERMTEGLAFEFPPYPSTAGFVDMQFPSTRYQALKDLAVNDSLSFRDQEEAYVQARVHAFAKKTALRNDASSARYSDRFSGTPPFGAYWKQDLKTYGVTAALNDDKISMYREKPRGMVVKQLKEKLMAGRKNYQSLVADNLADLNEVPRLGKDKKWM